MSVTRASHFVFWLQWLSHLGVLLLLAGAPVPGINESHYLPKAKHALDASFAPGDLFLESHDSHLVSTLFAGCLTRVMPLEAVAWAGRFVAWSLIALSWIYFTRALHMPAWLSPIALAGWYYAMSLGHWAGEWAIGGFEGKSIAYPMVLFGLSAVMQNRWKGAWLWFALAILWHPLVGLWAGASAGVVWLISAKDSQSGWRSQLPWLVLAGVISLVGILPALLGIGGADRDGPVLASQVHVYFRLAHHLSPLGFEPIRHQAAMTTLLLFAATSLGWWYARVRLKNPKSPNDFENRLWLAGTRLIQIALVSIVFALIGFTMDSLLSNQNLPSFRPATASKLLRFYWFRWADVAVPLSWTSLVWTLSIWLYSRQDFAKVDVAEKSGGESKREAKPDEELTQSRMVGVALLVLGVVATAWCAVERTELGITVAAADRLLLRDIPTPNNNASRLSDEKRLLDWQAVCYWIRDNTPTDSLWLTPKFQQSFKWYAHRAEVVCWKDVPQDNQAVLEWFRRIQITEPPRARNGMLRTRTVDELTALKKRYGFEWVLVDRRFEQPNENSLPLELVYPTRGMQNSSFFIYRLRD